MSEMERRKALLTGASRGIGEEMAKILAVRGYDLILVARNEERLQKITEDVRNINKVNCEYHVCDLSKETEIEKLIRAYPETDILINNAGFSSYGFFNKSAWERERDMIMVNIYALFRLCHHYVKGMVARNYGRILNVASTAGMHPTPFLSTYAGTKAFVIQFSKSLALELHGYDVSVSTLLPGPTATNFWEVGNMSCKVEKSFKHFDSPREVAEFGIDLMETCKIAGVPGWENKVKRIIKHYLPEQLWNFMVRQHMVHESLYKRETE